MQPGGFLRGEIRDAVSRDVRSAVLGIVLFGIGAAVAAGSSSIAAAVLGGIAGIFALSALRPLGLRAHPERHPSFAPLLAHHRTTLEQLSLDVERERAQNATPQTVTGFELLPSYLYRRSGRLLDLVRLDDIVWAYQLTTVQTRAGFEEGRAVDLVVNTPYAEMTLDIPSQSARALLFFLEMRVPWAVLGFDAERGKAWKDPRARAALIAQVAARRDEALGRLRP